MSKSSTTVEVRILDKEYLVACPQEEQEALLRAARHLDNKMREIRSSGKVFGTERIAVMAFTFGAGSFCIRGTKALFPALSPGAGGRHQ